MTLHRSITLQAVKYSLTLIFSLMCQRGIAAEAVPAVTVVVAGIDRILEQVDRVEELCDRSDLRPRVNGYLAAFNSLAGVDRSQPIAVCLFLDSQLASPPWVSVGIPVADTSLLTSTFQSIKSVDCEVIDEKSWRLKSSRLELAAQLNGDVLVITSADQRKGHREFYEAAVSFIGDKNDLSARLDVNALPSLLTSTMIREMNSTIQKELVRKSSEDDTEYEVRKLVTTMLHRLIEGYIQGTSQLELSYRLDSKIHLKTRWVARSTSALAEDFKQLAVSESSFPRLSNPDVFSYAHVNIQPPEIVRTTVDQVVTILQQKISKEVGSQLPSKDRHSAGGFFESVHSTIEKGRYEASFQLMRNNEGHLLFFSGTSMLKSDRLSEALKTVLPYVAHESAVKSVEIDSISDNDISIHRIQGTKLRKRDVHLYGSDPAIYLGTSSQGLIFAVGGAGMESLVSSLKDEKYADPPLLEMGWRLRPWIDVAKRFQPDASFIQVMDGSFSEAANDDQLLITIRAEENVLHGQVEAETGYLRWLANQLIPVSR